MVWSLGHSLSYGLLSTKAKIAWPVLLSECDEQGRFLAAPRPFKMSICPNIDEIGSDDVEELLSELESQGMIISYSHNGIQLGQVLRWWEYQSPTWAKASKYPAPQGWTDRVREKKGSKIELSNWDQPGGFDATTIQRLCDDHAMLMPRLQNRVVQNSLEQSSDDSERVPFSAVFMEVLGVLVPTAAQAEEIDAWMGAVPDDWFRDACKQAVDNNVRRWSYVRAILQRWEKEGRGNGEDKRRGEQSDDPYGFLATARRRAAGGAGQDRDQAGVRAAARGPG
jgi:DnaD/phage-associated family protein